MHYLQYVQARNNVLAYTDIQNWGAFMLGGNNSAVLMGEWDKRQPIIKQRG